MTNKHRIKACVAVAVALVCQTQVADATVSTPSITFTMLVDGMHWDGSVIHMLGLDASGNTKAMHYSPATWSSTSTTSSIAGANYRAYASIGTKMYLLGGVTSGASGVPTDEIQVYDSVADTATVASGTLPITLAYATAASDGSAAIYVFGGLTTTPPWPSLTSQSDAVIKYLPGTGASSIVAHLPAARWRSTAIQTGGGIFIVGGYGANCPNPPANCIGNQILKFDPTNNLVTIVGLLPVLLSDAGVAWDGTNLWIYGGTEWLASNNSTSLTNLPSNAIYKMTPSAIGTKAALAMKIADTLPTSEAYVKAEWMGSSALIVAGPSVSGMVAYIHS